MAGVDFQRIYNTELTDKQFVRLSDFIYNNYGIKMPPVKKIMLQSRLHKRLKALGMGSFDEYLTYVFDDHSHAEEVVNMIDVVSTNKTDFFREPAHFDFLMETALPHLMRNGSKRINIWSAGCSSGEEPYTMAICLNEFAEKNPGMDYSIKATDISTKVLQHAVSGVYAENRVDVIPLALKRKYFLKSKDQLEPKVKVVKQIRDKITFQRLNFMDNQYALNEVNDIVFCRNVLIYFDKKTQEAVIRKQCSKLRPGGFYFLGHSESTAGLDVPLRQIKPTIFERI